MKNLPYLIHDCSIKLHQTVGFFPAQVGKFNFFFQNKTFEYFLYLGWVENWMELAMVPYVNHIFDLTRNLMFWLKHATAEVLTY
jgi:hypothetical protein